MILYSSNGKSVIISKLCIIVEGYIDVKMVTTIKLLMTINNNLMQIKSISSYLKNACLTLKINNIYILLEYHKESEYYEETIINFN